MSIARIVNCIALKHKALRNLAISVPTPSRAPHRQIVLAKVRAFHLNGKIFHRGNSVPRTESEEFSDAVTCATKIKNNPKLPRSTRVQEGRAITYARGIHAATRTSRTGVRVVA